MITPADEASAILIRLFETLAHGMGKRLKEEYKSEIRRACELLATDGTLTPLDDLPKATPGERAAVYAEVPDEVERWRAERR